MEDLNKKLNNNIKISKYARSLNYSSSYAFVNGINSHAFMYFYVFLLLSNIYTYIYISQKKK